MITLKPVKCIVGAERNVCYRLAVVNHGTADINNVMSMMSIKNTVTRTDVLAVISALEQRAAYWLAQGYSVSLGDIGTMQLRISSKPADTKDKFSVANIVRSRVNFVPSSALKEAIRKGGYNINMRVSK